MGTLSTVKRSVAAALAADSAIETFCQLHWGRSLRVCLDDLGSYEDAEHPADAATPPTPYCIVAEDSDSEQGGERGEDTHTVAVRTVIDAQQDKDGGFADASKPLQGADGVWEVGDSSRFHGLMDLVRAAAGRDGHGALYRQCRASWDGVTRYPVQHCDQYFDFYTVNIF